MGTSSIGQQGTGDHLPAPHPMAGPALSVAHRMSKLSMRDGEVQTSPCSGVGQEEVQVHQVPMAPCAESPATGLAAALATPCPQPNATMGLLKTARGPQASVRAPWTAPCPRTCSSWPTQHRSQAATSAALPSQVVHPAGQAWQVGLGPQGLPLAQPLMSQRMRCSGCAAWSQSRCWPLSTHATARSRWQRSTGFCSAGEAWDGPDNKLWAGLHAAFAACDGGQG